MSFRSISGFSCGVWNLLSRGDGGRLSTLGGWECGAVFRRPVSIVFIIYVIIGIVVAWTRDYITIGLIKGVLSALLAIFLWFLPLLGVSLHLH